MNRDVETLCKLNFFPLCVISQRDVEIVYCNASWQQFLTTQWIDKFDKLYQDQILDVISELSAETAVLTCPFDDKDILLQFHLLGEDDRKLILILATTVAKTPVHNDIYTQLLTELIRHPSHDKRVIGSLLLMRKNLNDMIRLVSTSLNEDTISRDFIDQQLEDIKFFSEESLPQKHELTRCDLRRVLEDTSFLVGSNVIVEKRFDNNTNTTVMVDHRRVVALLETLLRVIYSRLNLSNKIIIEADVISGKKTILQIKYMYIGEKVLLKDKDPANIITSGYLDVVDASLTSEQIGARTVTILQLPVINIFTAAPAARPLKVVVVDDNYIILRLTRKYTEKCGHEIYEAMNGKEAVDLVKEKVPDIVFLDINIPIVDGFEVINIIRQWERENDIRKINIVVVTGFSKQYTKEMILAAGADAAQEKPLSLDRYRTYIDLFTQL
jgi:CheY-like chemotaxis protein